MSGKKLETNYACPNTAETASCPYRVERDICGASTELQYLLLRMVTYVDFGLRLVLDVRVDNGEELLKVVFAVLGPNRFVKLRHVHKELK